MRYFYYNKFVIAMRLFQPRKQSYYYGSRGGFALCSALPRLTAAEGSFFILDDKETNNQGLDLMSDKLVKALLVASTSSDEGSERLCCLGVVVG
ncbi:hypothetical protein J7E50_07175 [Pedobacter sp. ISL-68]|uniref:hypothetical protein n=1 Tax=unclassified Pedobacter TaxID=2628915 RepID=UPI001BE5B7C1|nr:MULTISPECIES: hypothetical protein [unclassified Pedobacter]MBT2560612.1 hypothetical protein [Pedobacter sp. ISL-64]MBT2589991.1 hypothetical protein [Pedobacter sp. ISL-68]